VPFNAEALELAAVLGPFAGVLRGACLGPGGPPTEGERQRPPAELREAARS
jgi:hypothetical protein